MRRKFLTVLGAGGAGDAFIHQRAAEIVGAGIEAGGGAIRPHLDPGCLNVGDQRVQRQAADGMHQHRFAECRAFAGLAAQIHRRLHVHERQRHEFGDAAGFGLQVAQNKQMPRPGNRALDMAVHNGRSRAQPLVVGGLDGRHPFRGVDLVGADDGANFVVQNFRRRARQRAKAGLFQTGQQRIEADAKGGRALGDFQRGKGMDVHARNRLSDRRANTDIGFAGIIRMDAALQADLGGATVPGFLRAAGDFLHREIIGRAAQGFVGFSLGKRAELAFVVADIGVVDVTVDDVTDHVTADGAAKRVGRACYVGIIDIAGGKQAHDFGFVEPASVRRAIDDAAQRRIDLAGKHGRGLGDCRVAGRPVIVAGEAVGIDHAADNAGEFGRQPGVRIARVGRIDRQPRHQDFADIRRALRQNIQFRPGCFRIDVIRRNRGYAPPIINAGGDQAFIVRRGKVRRCLQVHRRAKDQAGGGDGPKQIIQIGFFGVGALGVRLGAEILHDHFLDVTVLGMQVGDCHQAVQPFLAGFADADQDAGGERNFRFPGEANGFQPHRRALVRRTIMHPAGFA